MIFSSKVGGVLITAFSCALGLQMDAIPPADATRKAGQGVVLDMAAGAKQDEQRRQLMVALNDGRGFLNLFDIKGIKSHEVAQQVFNIIQAAIQHPQTEYDIFGGYSIKNPQTEHDDFDGKRVFLGSGGIQHPQTEYDFDGNEEGFEEDGRFGERFGKDYTGFDGLGIADVFGHRRQRNFFADKRSTADHHNHRGDFANFAG